MIEIKWLGHACFAITYKGYTILIDPYNSDYTAGYPKLRVKADKLLISHEHFGHNYREGVHLSGRPESDCPFAITALKVPHEFKLGNWRGFCTIHILEADGYKLVHMSDLGTQLDGGQISRLFGADVCMICAGSITALPSQEAKRATDEIMATAARTGWNLSRSLRTSLNPRISSTTTLPTPLPSRRTWSRRWPC